MKRSKFYKYLLILILLFNASLIAQAIDTVYVSADSLKDGSVDVGGAWLYHPGDDSLWADPDFDISDWDTLNPRMDLDVLPEGKWYGIGWFRKFLAIDSALYGTMVALRLDHYGASEIYVNANKIHSYGNVSALPDSEKIYRPLRIPLAVKLDSSGIQQIAVRYSNHQAITNHDIFKKWFRRAGFSMQIYPLNDTITSSVGNAKISYAVNFGISGLFFALSLLYIFLFVFYARRKENFFYSMFNLFIALIFASNMLAQLSTSSLTFYHITRLVSAFAIAYIFLAYLGFLYSIFYQKFPKQFWFFLATALLITAFMFLYIERDIINYTLFGFILAATLEGLRIIIIALKRKKENAWVIGTGVMFFVAFVLTLFVVGFLGKNIDSITGVLFFFVGILSLPISMSIYLARDIASTNKKLAKQLETVQELNQLQIDQERKNAELKLQAELAEAESARKSKELEEARQLQLSMLPESVPQLPNVDISVYMKTATEVGGDYYDFNVSSDGTLNIAFGDATGHGMQSGTLVSMMKALFTSEAARQDIPQFFVHSSNSIKQIRLGRLMMAFTLLRIQNHSFQLCSAGMPPVYIYRAESKTVEEYDLQGMPLGALKDFDYQIKTGLLEEGDCILLLSDGFPELKNNKDEQFGYVLVQDVFVKVADSKPDQIINKLIKEGEEWLADQPLDDDITIMAIKVKKAS